MLHETTKHHKALGELQCTWQHVGAGHQRIVSVQCGLGTSQLITSLCEGIVLIVLQACALVHKRILDNLKMSKAPSTVDFFIGR